MLLLYLSHSGVRLTLNRHWQKQKHLIESVLILRLRVAIKSTIANLLRASVRWFICIQTCYFLLANNTWKPNAVHHCNCKRSRNKKSHLSDYFSNKYKAMKYMAAIADTDNKEVVVPRDLDFAQGTDRYSCESTRSTMTRQLSSLICSCSVLTRSCFWGYQVNFDVSQKRMTCWWFNTNC